MNASLLDKQSARTETVAEVCAQMKKIPAGPFQMGSVKNGGEFEQPIHEVYLNEFEIDATPVTNRQFRAFVKQTGYLTTAQQAGSAWGFDGMQFRAIEGLSWLDYATPSRELHPAVLVSWEDAVAYASWAKKRLPTEAEWEKAALGGESSGVYPWGAGEPDGTQCNFAQRPGRFPPTTEVGKFPPNAYGLYDMVGNIWQWCSDWYSEKYYGSSPVKNPRGPAEGALRVRRGGSWNVIQPFRLRCANRGAVIPTMSAPNIGFRCVRDVL